ncbi:amidohydrolase [Muricauda sp. 334s03]|uniref:Amidohydrolase n=1 Tax=Flagellimonas yonaguniensis TaxID=3031325 RepID=A0ABT5XYM4_9FLAO|nr:amidohydrolase [[Muricauda] yonaguniensis]MDF0716245.1 amidohydrolase [[Muricauda] yonaguniensis]
MIGKEILELRHKLHANPDLSNEECKTAGIIKDFIAEYDPTEIIEGIGGTGLAVVYKFSNEGPTIAIRCELDALPIKEPNPIPYKSNNKGVSHKCGHDGHMSIVASITTWLKEQPLESGSVVLLFQPAEETGEGAKRVIEDERFKDLQTDYVFALHNIPKEPMHSIILMDNGFSAEVISVVIKLKGKESHASEPENGINPAMGLSEMIQGISKLNVSDISHPNFAIATPVHINMGQKSYGISPAHGELHYTLRTWTTSKMNELKSNLEHLVRTIGHQHKLKWKLEWLEHFPASILDKESNEVVRHAAKANNYKISERKTPFKFGEDFGWFSKKYKTAMFGIGAGESTPALHHADYDFPDELLTTGFAMFKSIILNLTEEK